jgi:hypothetical protein
MWMEREMPQLKLEMEKLKREDPEAFEFFIRQLRGKKMRHVLFGMKREKDPAAKELTKQLIQSEFRSLLLSLDNRFREITERLSEFHAGIHVSEKSFSSSNNTLNKEKGDETPFLIAKGNATIVENMKNHTFSLINLQKDDFFGPIPFLEMGHEPYSASVWFSDDIEVTPLDSEALQSEYDQLSDTFKNIIEFSLNCISIATLAVRRHCLERMKGKSL